MEGPGKGQGRHLEPLQLLSNVYLHNLHLTGKLTPAWYHRVQLQPTAQGCAGSPCQGKGAALRLQEQQSCLQPRAAAGMAGSSQWSVHMAQSQTGFWLDELTAFPHQFMSAVWHPVTLSAGLLDLFPRTGSSLPGSYKAAIHNATFWGQRAEHFGVVPNWLQDAHCKVSLGNRHSQDQMGHSQATSYIPFQITPSRPREEEFKLQPAKVLASWASARPDVPDQDPCNMCLSSIHNVLLFP